MIVIRSRTTNDVLHSIDADTLSGADLAGADLADADLADADLAGADLTNAVLKNADLMNAHLKGADLSNAYLTGANLKGANLADTDLTGANLADTDLRNAILTNAVLKNADLMNAHLADTRLSGVLMVNAKLIRAKFWDTVFIACDTLHLAEGLDQIEHRGRSSLDHRTLSACIEHLSDTFLTGVGYAVEEIPSLRAFFAGEGTHLDEKGNLLRLYVPQGRYQAEQMDTFIRLFENYLNKVERCPVKVETLKSSEGTLYLFKSLGDEDIANGITDAIGRFNDFLGLCYDDPNAALNELKKLGVASEVAAPLITKYGKQHQRLRMDMQDELEQRTLQLQQAMRRETFELMSGGQPTVQARQVTPSDALMCLNSADQSPVVVFLGDSSHARQVADALTHRIFGGADYTPDEKELIRVIEEKAETRDEKLTAKSDLDILKDETATPEMRKLAKRGLSQWWDKYGSTVVESGTKTIVEAVIKGLTGGG